MIIKGLLDLELELLQNFLSDTRFIPELPADLLEILATLIEYLLQGIDLLTMFLGVAPVRFMGICFDLIILANLFYFGYSVVMWFMQKIPFWGIK